MNRFNFLLRDPRLTEGRSSNITFSARTQRAFVACSAAILLTAATSLYERARLTQAIQMTHRTQAEAASAEQSLRALRADTVELSRYSAAARSIIAIRTENESRLASVIAVGDAIPNDAVLLELRDDGTSIALRGRVHDASGLASTMRALSRVRQIASPELLWAHGVSDQPGIEFAMRVTER